MIWRYEGSIWWDLVTFSCIKRRTNWQHRLRNPMDGLSSTLQASGYMMYIITDCDILHPAISHLTVIEEAEIIIHSSYNHLHRLHKVSFTHNIIYIIYYLLISRLCIISCLFSFFLSSNGVQNHTKGRRPFFSFSMLLFNLLW